MKQTAVEWLLDNLISEPYSEEDFQHNSNMWDKAKEIEKQQIIDFADNYVDNCVIPNENMAIPTIIDVPQYYNETFKNK